MSVNCPFSENIFNFGRDSLVRRNLITEISFPSTEENLVEIEVIHDLELPGNTQLRRIELGYFFPLFGDIDFRSIESTVNAVDFDDFGFSVNHRSEETVPDGSVVQTATFCFDTNLKGEISFTTRFQVRNSICNIEGEQAIPATWFPIVEDGFIHSEIDYRVPVGNGGLSDGFIGEFQPQTSFEVVIDRSEDNFLTILIPYAPADIALNGDEDDFDRIDVFLFLGEVVFDNAPECPILEIDLTLFFIAAAVLLPMCACCCLIGVACVNRYYDERNARLRNEAHRNRFNLFFPGDPDIVLRPDVGAVNTVQAVPEDQDPHELDAAIPTTTINVRIDEENE